jgi:hypothetical protein
MIEVVVLYGLRNSYARRREFVECDLFDEDDHCDEIDQVNTGRLLDRKTASL